MNLLKRAASHLRTLAAQHSTAVIFLDLGSEQLADTSTAPVSTVLYWKVLQWAGYSSEKKLAELEFTLEARGQADRFRRAYQEKFGDDWGIAYNSWHVRTQCHLHLHVGRFIRASENSKYKLVRRPEDFPAPVDVGVMIHPVPGGYHVHSGERIMETMLLR